jgi:putative phosphoesterase
MVVVADIHGNLTALDAVIDNINRRGVTEVAHAGDLALLGARPAEVVDRVAELGWPGVVGNVDELLWRPEVLEVQLRAAPKLDALLRRLFDVYAPATLAMLDESRLHFLQALPATLETSGISVVHATPGDLWSAPAPDAGEDAFSVAYEALECEIVVYGHLHRPFVRRFGFCTVANAGSVGMPWDGDPRASYLVVDKAEIEIVRVGYDIEREINAVKRSGYPDSGRIADMLRSGRFVPVRK